MKECLDGYHYFESPDPKSLCNCRLWQQKKFDTLKSRGIVKTKGRRLYLNGHKERAMRDQSKPVIQIDIYGEVIAIFAGVGEASLITGVPRYSITDCLIGKRKTSTKKMYRWEYV